MADKIPETMFERLRGRAANDADRRRLFAVQAQLGLSDRDELWPILITLDHYTEANRASVGEVLKNIKRLPQAVGEAVGVAEASARAKAESALAKVVEAGAQRIAAVVVQRTQTTADNVSAKQRNVTGIAGAVVALACISVGVAAAYFYFQARGICAESPFRTTNGETLCVVDTVSRG
jgi:hypothetical protein